MSGPLDERPDQGRQAVVVASALLSMVDALAILCGENFLTHEEHEEISMVAENAAQRWSHAQRTLKDLDFEP